MSVDARARAVRAAQDAGMTIGEWMELAIARMLENHPAPPPAESSSEARTALQVADRGRMALRALDAATGDLVKLVRVIEAAGALAQATGRPIPRPVSRAVYARLLAQLEQSG